MTVSNTVGSFFKKAFTLSHHTAAPSAAPIETAVKAALSDAAAAKAIPATEPLILTQTAAPEVPTVQTHADITITAAPLILAGTSPLSSAQPTTIQPETPVAETTPIATTTTPSRTLSVIGADIEAALQRSVSVTVMSAEWLDTWIKTNMERLTAEAETEFRTVYAEAAVAAKAEVNELVTEYNEAHNYVDGKLHAFFSLIATKFSTAL